MSSIFKTFKGSEQYKIERDARFFWLLRSVTWVYRRYAATLSFLNNLYLISDFFHSFYVNSGKEKKERLYNCKICSLKLIHLLYNVTPKSPLSKWKFHQYLLNTLYNQGNKSLQGNVQSLYQVKVYLQF